jgi:hypothetical protein
MTCDVAGDSSKRNPTCTQSNPTNTSEFTPVVVEDQNHCSERINKPSHASPHQVTPPLLHGEGRCTQQPDDMLKNSQPSVFQNLLHCKKMKFNENVKK